MLKTIEVVVITFVLCFMLAGCHVRDLSVEISWPYNGMRVYNTPVPVKGTVSNSSATVTINSTPVVVAENGYFVGSADLIEGENTITIVAMIEERETVTKTITVIYMPEK